MKTERIFVITTLFIMAVTAPAEEWKPAEWPILKHYDSAHLRQIALPLGGIGTGTVSLGGRGCLVDQLVGQYMAHICGLGYLGDKDHIQTTLHSIMKYNFLPDFSRHFNNMRSYVLGKEGGLLMAAWPKGRLEVPFPYFPESMTGFEYCAAVGMLYEDMTEDGLKCIKAIRDRFDGSKRNPFSEPECGHHYARSMASWAAVIALSDFHYSGVSREMSFTDCPGNYFWSNGYAWGTCRIQSDGSVALTVLKGSLPLDALTIGNRKFKVKKVLKEETWKSS